MPEDRFQVSQSPVFQVEKGKGCNAMIAFEGAQDSVNVFLGGVGVASFSNDRTNPPQTFAQIAPQGTTSMEWVSNRFSATSAALGDINVTFQTIGNSPTRSSLVLIPERSGNLLPARMVNTLYFEMSIPSQGITVFNKDPLVLESRSINANAETFRLDPRFVRDPEAVPRRLQAFATGEREPVFLPVGNHQQRRPVFLYSKENPDQRVATIFDSTVHVIPHYGLELALISSSRVDEQIVAEVEVENLTQVAQEVHWFVDGIHNLTVTSHPVGSAYLGARNGADSRFRLKVSGRRKNPDEPLGQLDCLVVGVTNRPESIDDFVSDCILLSVE